MGRPSSEPPERADCVWARKVEMALGLTCVARGHEADSDFENDPAWGERGSFLRRDLEVWGLAAGEHLREVLRHPRQQHGRACSGLGFASNSAYVIIHFYGMRNCSNGSALRPW